MHSQYRDSIEIDYEKLLSDAVGNIVKNEDAPSFLRWLRENLLSYVTLMEEEPDADFIRPMATHLGRAIWNGTPLPGNQLQPKPIEEPGRNEACLCGSGQKYKNCCGAAPEMGGLESRILWPFLVNHLSKKTLESALKQQKMPVAAVIYLADDYRQRGKTAKAVKTLEALFKDDILQTDLDAEYALTLLCNLYDQLGYYRKKSDLLFRVIETVPRSTLRSGAWQRLAAIFMDAEENDKAWWAFQQAMQDDPESPGVALLEVQLQAAEKQYSKASERADFWYRKLVRNGHSETEEYMGMLQEYIDHPAEAFIHQNLEAVMGVGAGLKQWLDRVADQPLPKYKLEALPPDILGEDDVGQYTPYMLQPGAKIHALERKWRHTFPGEKPFSTQDMPTSGEAIWHPEMENAWIAFLEKNPQAFSSLEVLDDLAGALLSHPQFGAPWVDEHLMLPILERSKAIIEKAIGKKKGAVLPWVCVENRPGMRNLHRLVGCYFHSGREEESKDLERRMLELNPSDNHGYRSQVINDLLREGKDTDAIALAERYNDDVMAETVYGRILALYRLNRLNDAEQALKEAKESLPKVIPYLVRNRIKKPKISGPGYYIGGDDQAWMYRDAMRPVWLATPGALDWLQKMAKYK